MEKKNGENKTKTKGEEKEIKYEKKRDEEEVKR